MKMAYGTLVVAGLALALPVSAFGQQPANCSAESIPDKPLEYRVGAQNAAAPPLVRVRKIAEIKSGAKVYDQYLFSLADKDMFAETETEFSVIVPKGQRLDGKTFRKLPTADTSAQPGPEQGLPEVQGWKVKDKPRKLDLSHVGYVASLRADVGARRGDVLPVRVYLCVPGNQTEKMFGTKLADAVTLVGRFEATVADK